MVFGCLIGFIVSKEGIRVDPLKVEAILQLSPLRNIRHLQCLQGMANFLRRFVVNFANLTRGFMRLLKKDTTFSWDQRAQESFDALKWALTSSSMISPPDHSHDSLLYVVASMEMIGMFVFRRMRSSMIMSYIIWAGTSLMHKSIILMWINFP